jgi:hypothetical protein
MTASKIIHTSDFDYENVVKRLKQAEQRRDRQPEAKTPPRANRAPSRPEPAPPQPRQSKWRGLSGGLFDESKQLTAAALVLLGFGGWMVSSAQALYTQREQTMLAGACAENQLAHAGSTYCFDQRRIVHTLNADRTTQRPGLDWRVNEVSHRMAEAAAAREARARNGQ